jgi:branched-chain amino acid transport system ATP-binding protein
MTEALKVEGLASGYGTSEVVSDVSFTLAESEVLAIVGRNGMGKTSLLKTVLGFLPAWRGTIHLSGKDVTRTPPHLKRRLGLVYVPQEQALFQDLTIRDNLRLGVFSDRDLNAALDQVGQWFPVLTQRLQQRAGTLSGGEQKMLNVARALLPAPRIVLLDEVSEGLQPSLVERVRTALAHEQEATGLTLLLVEQNVEFVLGAGGPYALLERGRVVGSGHLGDGDAGEKIERHLAI